MKQKLLLIALSIFILSVVTTDSFAKKLEKDAAPKKQTTKVAKKVQIVQRTDSKNPDVQTQKDPSVNLNTVATEFSPSTSSSMTGEQINWQVVASGGLLGSSSNFNLSGTVGQTSVGLGTATNFQLNAGFWQIFGTPSCCIADRGNVDSGPDNGTFPGSVDIADLVFLVSFMFQNGATPLCDEEANIDGVGIIDISDLVGLVGFMFQSGAPPASCS